MTPLALSTGELWLPNLAAAEYDVPTTTELESLWQKFHGEADMLELSPEIYGACTVPDSMPVGFAAIDLCEVVRMSGGSLLSIRGGTIDDMVADGETSSMDYGSTYNGWSDEVAQANRHYFLDEFMRQQVVEPVPFIGSIGSMLRSWRSRGIYVVADTSTLPGCEAATVEFLGVQLQGGFDGILLPRNHDGKGPITKLTAFDDLRRSVGEAFDSHASFEVPVVAIDDAVHHAVGFAAGEGDIEVLVPAWLWNSAVESMPGRVIRVAQQFGTLDSFIAADQYFGGKGL